MEYILELLKTDTFLYIMLGSIILLFVLYISTVVNITKLRKSYIKFMKKLGNGDNVDEMLRTYIGVVQKVENKNNELTSYCEQLDKHIEKCTQKIGMVRYNAFRDTGSDLSFALALLDENNNGVVLNGIYARDMSNIYAKPVEKGTSKYALSEEEKEAISRAMSQE